MVIFWHEESPLKGHRLELGSSTVGFLPGGLIALAVDSAVLVVLLGALGLSLVVSDLPEYRDDGANTRHHGIKRNDDKESRRHGYDHCGRSEFQANHGAEGCPEDSDCGG